MWCVGHTSLIVKRVDIQDPTKRAMEIRLILLALASAAVLSVSAKQARFDNYQILSVKLTNVEQRAFFVESAEASESIMVLSETEGGVEIAVAPENLADVSYMFARNNIQIEVAHRNLQEYGHKVADSSSIEGF